MGGFAKFLTPLKGVIAKYLNRLILARMGKAAEDLARIGEEIGDLVLQEVLKAQETGLPGAEKKQAVTDAIIAIIREPGGIDAPEVILELLHDLLPDLIEAAVAKAKAAGLFPS